MERGIPRCVATLLEGQMRFFKTMLTSASMLLASVATAGAAPVALLQVPKSPVKVDVHTTETHTIWYAEPIWIAVGAIVVLLIIVLAVLAGRGRDGGSSTTVIR
jgi:archaellum biogenesis protein FlaJ (TadC family)